MSAQPAMPPGLVGRVRVVGYGGDTSKVSFQWKLDVRGKYRTRPLGGKGDWRDYGPQDVAEGSQIGTNVPWKPDYIALVGGWGHLVVTATLPGVEHNPVTSDPRWIDIAGGNPGVPAVKAFIDGHAGEFAGTVTQIDCYESGRTLNQFKPVSEGREPPSTNIPAGWPNPAPLRPLFGAEPAGIGIAQKDPSAFPSQQWNWQANVLAGIAVYQQGYAAAGQSRGRAQHALNQQLSNLLNVVNRARAAAHLPPLHLNAILVPDFTPDQRVRDAIRRYNGGTEYEFDAVYVAANHGLDVSLTGSLTWVKIRHATNPHYVEDVLGCHI
jgi:hypothetical protein